MQYRHEIDGLRAVAVIPVIFFHAGFKAFSGGFVGVDVFFVISGYLITSIIINERANGTFSLLGFYERRARRILPALFFVIVCCLPFAWMWMLPDPLENFGQSIFATVFSANNILLWLTSGYWELASEFKPLMHTWSLAVEEQFYIFYPLLVLILWRFGKSITFFVILFLFSASLISSEIFSRTQPIGNFYFLHTRAWELLAGAICAFIQFKGQQRSHNILSAFGLCLVVFSIFYYDKETPFPSLYALAPVLGTVLIILFSAGKTWTAQLLSTRFFVGIGLVSYSAYLWHQPIFAFTRINSYNAPSHTVMFSLSILSIACAYVTWRFIERPFRSRDKVLLRPFLITISFFAISLASFGGILHFQHGIPRRMFTIDDENTAAGMYIGYNESVFQYKKSSFPVNDKKNVLIIGNSYARDFINAGIESGRFAHHNIVYLNGIISCIERSENYKETQSKLIATADIVIFASGVYDVSCVDEDVELLKGQGVQQVIIIGTKDFGYNLNKFIQLDADERVHARSSILKEILQLNEKMKHDIPPKHFVDVIGMLSDDGTSMPVFTKEGYLISQDRRHLTREGAEFIGDKIFKHKLLQQF